MARRAKAGGESHPQVALCVLLGLLLGLYPKAVRFPPFRVRVALYRRVHRLITGGDAGFCARHPMLMALAFMEYCSHVVPAYMPAEEEVLAGEPGIAGLFQGCGLVCDNFRQEVLVTGEEPWQAMDAYCAPHVERHLRACRSKGARPRGADAKVPGAQFCLEVPRVVPYDAHLEDPTHRLMGAEMAFLGVGGGRHEHTAAMQRLISTSPLPGNLRDLQLRALARRAGACERSAVSLATLHVCVACVLSGQSGLVHSDRKKEPRARGECRLDVETGRLLCASCQGDCVVSVSALGRIVALRQCRYYYAPCCGAVRLYAATGEEFTGTECRHGQAKGGGRGGRHRCELCPNLALAEGITRVDHLTGELRTARLCQRHTPHEDSLGMVVNWRQLEAEVRRRDRPLFRNER